MTRARSQAGNNGVARAAGAGAALLPARTKPPARPAPEMASFLAPVLPSSEDRAWPLHCVVWFRPELPPRLPESSGLGVERQSAAPLPGFVSLEPGAGQSVPDLSVPCGPKPPHLTREWPRAELAPVGWDPRTEVGRADAVAAGGEDR